DVDPPRRVLVASLWIGGDARLERAALAQRAAQYRVHVALGIPFLEQAAGAHRLVDDGVRGISAGLERVESTPQERLDQVVGLAPMGKLSHHCLHAAKASQGSVREVEQRGARGRAPATFKLVREALAGG